jgi:hypothetical protein
VHYSVTVSANCSVNIYFLLFTSCARVCGLFIERIVVLELTVNKLSDNFLSRELAFYCVHSLQV